jgi:oxygen-independent coproporphyrinogen-3 oxidase
MMTTNKTSKPNRNVGLYIHLPFCQRKCSYCGFLSLVNQPTEVIQNYIYSLIAESRLQQSKIEKNTKIDTIYIGGGTPSLLNGNDMSILLEGIRDVWPITNTCEITMEANPNTLTGENLHAYGKAGINRLSIGIQSFNDSILSGIGRLHDANCAKNAVKLAKEEGFKNINLDLMFGLPGQTLQQWKETLLTAVSLDPAHLSLYTLQIEEGTKLYQDYKSEKLPLVNLEVDRACYHYAIEFLKHHGYEQYEISNFAKAGYECKHNIKYWSLAEFLGIGLNASSYVHEKRWRNLSDLDSWSSQINNGTLPIDTTTLRQDTLKDAIGIFLFTGLRKTKGISFEEFSHCFGQDFFQVFANNMDQLNKYRTQGFLDWSDPKEGRLWITEAGVDSSNEIMSEFV